MDCNGSYCKYCRHYSNLFEICLIEFEIEIAEMLRKRKRR